MRLHFPGPPPDATAHCGDTEPSTLNFIAKFHFSTFCGVVGENAVAVAKESGRSRGADSAATQGDDVVAMVVELGTASEAECPRIAEAAATIIDKYQEGSHLLDAYLGSSPGAIAHPFAVAASQHTLPTAFLLGGRECRCCAVEVM